jgi:membrane protein YdbS with pleckstrin-like domain
MASLREKYPLESIKPLKKTIESIWGTLFIIVFFGIFYSTFARAGIEQFLPIPSISTTIFILIGIFIVYIILKYIYEIFYMKYYLYDLAKEHLIIKKGVFSRNEITLPINRLQDVYVDQDILDRIFGLYDVHVSSATIISGNLSHIDGLNKENAQAIKKLILSGIHKEK